MWDLGKQTWLLPINLRLMTEETEVSEHKVFDKDAVDSKKAQPVRDILSSVFNYPGILCWTDLETTHKHYYHFFYLAACFVHKHSKFALVFSLERGK